MNNNLINDNDSLDLGTIFRIVLMQSKLIFFFIFFGITLGISAYLFSEKIYRVTSLLQVYSNQSNIGNDIATDFVLGGANTVDINNIEKLYKTRQNFLEIIDEFQLNISTTETDEFDLSNIITLESTENNNLLSSKRFILDFSENYIKISSSDSAEEKLTYGEEKEFEKYRIKINKPEDIPTKPINVLYINPEKYFKTLRNKFSISTTVSQNSFYNKSSGLVEISYISNDIDLGKKVLNFANNLYLQRNIASESEKAKKAIEFIDLRINAVENILDNNKDALKNFKELNSTVDVDLEIQSIIEKTSQIESKLNDMEIELAKARNNYTQDNPIYLDLINQRNAILNQKTVIEERIRNLPLAQQEYIDLFSDVEISQQLYTQLVNKKLEFSILEASTLGNMRVVDDSYFQQKVSPSLMLIIFNTLIFSILGFMIAIIRGIYFTPISNPAELADNNINNPIIGVIPKVEDDDGHENNERFKQSIESLTYNLSRLSLEKSCKLLITSPTQSNGKSFLSRSIAESIAKLDKKVLLIDADYKRGILNNFYKKEKLNDNDFLSLNKESMEKYKVNDNFYFIPKIRSLLNSFQFVYSEDYLNKIKYFEEHFDYIIFDTAPVLSVSDTNILCGICDLNVLINRHGVSKLSEVKQSISILDQLGLKFAGIIYNAYEKPSSYYGYYGFYGNYQYQYYAKKYLYESYEYKTK